MSQRSIQDILPLVAKPSRYLGLETNIIRKNHANVALRIVLAFPDMYEIGTSHFGLQILYHLLNQQNEIVAERVFAPDVDMQRRLQSSDLPLVSLESHQALINFDIIGFSLLYELNYTNILTILELSNIPFYARSRNDNHPLIVAGGPCTCNPEPVAEFFDAMVIGDGEGVIIKMTQKWLEWKKGGRRNRALLLEQWSHIEGVYIPCFFDPVYTPDGFQKLVPKQSGYRRIKRAIVDDLDQAPFPEAPVVPFGKPVHDRLRLEVARGCTRGCRFCQAGMIYRPVRERSVDTILGLTQKSLDSTGYEDLSLLSLSTGDYECIAPLMRLLMARCASDHVAVSLPSLRAGTLTPELMTLIKKVRKTGFTIAPEAGSQRLRNVINKNISEEEIVATVENAFQLGWQVIKLYFMIGLPTESDEDLEAIVKLVDRLGKLKRSSKRRGQINVSVATFIPKSHTPFQWDGQISVDESRRRIQWLQNQLRRPGISFKWQHPDVSHLEGLWARGDRRLSQLLVAAYQRGCQFDGWSDHFNYHQWLAACRDTGVDLDFYTVRRREKTEPFPWDHIDSRVTKDFLWEESIKARSGQPTSDCRKGDCNQCGVCDFEVIAPKVFDVCRSADSSLPGNGQPDETVWRKYRIVFSKTGPARFFGHLEMVNLFIRAINRADITVKYSKGFHPKPRLIFKDALPVGLESRHEILFITAADPIGSDEILNRLNSQLPQGLVVDDCQLAASGAPAELNHLATYQVYLPGGAFTADELERFKQQREHIVTRTNRKGKVKKVDLRAAVDDITVVTDSKMEMALQSSSGKIVRPSEILKEIFTFTDEQLKFAKIIKIRPRSKSTPAAK